MVILLVTFPEDSASIRLCNLYTMSSSRALQEKIT